MGFVFFLFQKKLVQLVPPNVPQMPLPLPITENGVRVHSVQYDMNECVRFYILYEQCQPLQLEFPCSQKFRSLFPTISLIFYFFMVSYFHGFYLVSHGTDTPRQNASFSSLMTLTVVVFSRVHHLQLLLLQ